MKKSIIITAIAAFAAVEFVNAQNNAQVDNQLVERLAQKAIVYPQEEGKPVKTDAISAVSDHTYIYDATDLKMEYPDIAGKYLRMVAEWQIERRRNALSGVAVGVDAGGVMLAENFSPAGGFHVTMSWKKIDLTGGFLGATNVYNEESTMAGKRFFAGMAYGELGYNARFAMRGYNNMGVIVPFVGYMFIFDKNANDINETILVNGGSITYDGMSDIKGNSSAIYGGIKARFNLKHMGATALTIKAFGGVYQRYYLEGSKRKPFAGVTVGLEFSGAKKRVDSDVKALENSLKSGDYTLANEVIKKINETRGNTTVK